MLFLRHLERFKYNCYEKDSFDIGINVKLGCLLGAGGELEPD